MGILTDLGIDALGEVHIAQDGWQATALAMIEQRRVQVTTAYNRVTNARQHVALIMELKRLSDLEFYVHACQNGGITARPERDGKLMDTAVAGASLEDVEGMKGQLAARQGQIQRHTMLTVRRESVQP